MMFCRNSKDRQSLSFSFEVFDLLAPNHLTDGPKRLCFEAWCINKICLARSEGPQIWLHSYSVPRFCGARASVIMFHDFQDFHVFQDFQDFHEFQVFQVFHVFHVFKIFMFFEIFKIFKFFMFFRFFKIFKFFKFFEIFKIIRFSCFQDFHNFPY